MIMKRIYFKNPEKSGFPRWGIIDIKCAPLVKIFIAEKFTSSGTRSIYTPINANVILQKLRERGQRLS